MGNGWRSRAAGGHQQIMRRAAHCWAARTAALAGVRTRQRAGVARAGEARRRGRRRRVERGRRRAAARVRLARGRVIATAAHGRARGGQAAATASSGRVGVELAGVRDEGGGRRRLCVAGWSTERATSTAAAAALAALAAHGARALAALAQQLDRFARAPAHGAVGLCRRARRRLAGLGAVNSRYGLPPAGRQSLARCAGDVSYAHALGDWRR